jgi:hypothetical protein
MRSSGKRLGLALCGLGLVGVISLAALPVERLAPGPLPAPAEVLRALSLINPALLVITAALVGTRLAPRIGLDAPAIRALLAGSSPVQVLRRQGTKSLWVGLAAGALLAAYALVTEPYFASLGADAASRLEGLTPPLIVKILYGGVAEEIMARWGLMTLVSWLAWWLAGRPAAPPGAVYWIGILAAALAFAASHLPFLYALTGSPPHWLLALVLAGNGIAGVAFGWLYWRAGLEAAIMAHALAHVVATLLTLF